MNRSIRATFKRNNELGQQLRLAYRHVYTDIVTNLRTGTLEESETEEAIEDVLDLLLCAQERGETVERVFGGKDVKQFCAEIVASSRPRLFTWNKALGQLKLFIMCAGLLWAIEMIGGMMSWLIRGIPLSWDYSFTWGTILKYVACYLLCMATLRYIGREVKSTKITMRNRIIVASLFLVNLAILVSVTFWVSPIPILTLNSAVIALGFVVAYFLFARIQQSIARRE
ncbi:DUF1048 domain-containing protein [Paenibacillus sp. SI8]|uniref:DUF1048 domain-containing protein n=1 Tax=unclassified Paenibacillus TaxID=185978 RepID=UPI00346590C7